jgi:hypothetical protein
MLRERFRDEGINSSNSFLMLYEGNKFTCFLGTEAGNLYYYFWDFREIMKEREGDIKRGWYL